MFAYMRELPTTDLLARKGCPTLAAVSYLHGRKVSYSYMYEGRGPYFTVLAIDENCMHYSGCRFLFNNNFLDDSMQLLPTSQHLYNVLCCNVPFSR